MTHFDEQQLVELANVIKRVQTPEGVKKFGQPIGTIITPDMEAAAKLKGVGDNLGKASPIGVNTPGKTQGAFTGTSPVGVQSAPSASVKKVAHADAGLKGAPSVVIKPSSDLNGPEKFKVVGTEFSAPAGSKLYKNDFNGLAVVVSPDGGVYMFAKTGEVDLSPDQQGYYKTSVGNKDSFFKGTEFEVIEGPGTPSAVEEPVVKKKIKKDTKAEGKTNAKPGDAKSGAEKDLANGQQGKAGGLDGSGNPPSNGVGDQLGSPDLPNLDEYKKVSGQKGSNPGGVYTAPDGTDVYVKHPKSLLHGENEILASDLYEALGVSSAKVKKGTLGGKVVTFSPMIPDAKSDLSTKIKDPKYKKALQEGFAADAWMANWDVAGLSMDNVVTDANGDPVRVDPGGALLFRAQGEKKGDSFGDKVGEFKTLTDGTNSQSTKVFGDMSEADKKASVSKLFALDDKKIDALVSSAISDPVVAASLSDTLKARRLDALQQFGLSVKTGKPSLEFASGNSVPLLGDGLESPSFARLGELEKQGLHVPAIYELDSASGAASSFRDSMLKLKENNKFHASVYVYDTDEYSKMRLFTNDDGTAGFALKGDELVSVFVHSDSKDKGSARALVATAVNKGATRLDAFDTILPKIYAKEGFKAVSRPQFDENYKPGGWESADYLEWNKGKPDVVFMAYDKSSVGSVYNPNDGDYEVDYDSASAVAEKAAAGHWPSASKGAEEVSPLQGIEHLSPSELGTQKTWASSEVDSGKPEYGAAITLLDELLAHQSGKKSTLKKGTPFTPGFFEHSTPGTKIEIPGVSSWVMDIDHKWRKLDGQVGSYGLRKFGSKNSQPVVFNDDGTLRDQYAGLVVTKVGTEDFRPDGVPATYSAVDMASLDAMKPGQAIVSYLPPRGYKVRNQATVKTLVKHEDGTWESYTDSGLLFEGFTPQQLGPHLYEPPASEDSGDLVKSNMKRPKGIPASAIYYGAKFESSSFPVGTILYRHRPPNATGNTPNKVYPYRYMGGDSWVGLGKASGTHSAAELDDFLGGQFYVDSSPATVNSFYDDITYSGSVFTAWSVGDYVVGTENIHSLPYGTRVSNGQGADDTYVVLHGGSDKTRELRSVSTGKVLTKKEIDAGGFVIIMLPQPVKDGKHSVLPNPDGSYNPPVPEGFVEEEGAGVHSLNPLASYVSGDKVTKFGHLRNFPVGTRLVSSGTGNSDTGIKLVKQVDGSWSDHTMIDGAVYPYPFSELADDVTYGRLYFKDWPETAEGAAPSSVVMGNLYPDGPAVSVADINEAISALEAHSGFQIAYGLKAVPDNPIADPETLDGLKTKAVKAFPSLTPKQAVIAYLKKKAGVDTPSSKAVEGSPKVHLGSDSPVTGKQGLDGGDFTPGEIEGAIALLKGYDKKLFKSHLVSAGSPLGKLDPAKFVGINADKNESKAQFISVLEKALADHNKSTPAAPEVTSTPETKDILEKVSGVAPAHWNEFLTVEELVQVKTLQDQQIASGIESATSVDSGESVTLEDLAALKVGDKVYSSVAGTYLVKTSLFTFKEQNNSGNTYSGSNLVNLAELGDLKKAAPKEPLADWELELLAGMPPKADVPVPSEAVEPSEAFPTDPGAEVTSVVQLDAALPGQTLINMWPNGVSFIYTKKGDDLWFADDSFKKYTSTETLSHMQKGGTLKAFSAPTLTSQGEVLGLQSLELSPVGKTLMQIGKTDGSLTFWAKLPSGKWGSYSNEEGALNSLNATDLWETVITGNKQNSIENPNYAFLFGNPPYKKSSSVFPEIDSYQDVMDLPDDSLIVWNSTDGTFNSVLYKSKGVFHYPDGDEVISELLQDYADVGQTHVIYSPSSEAEVLTTGSLEGLPLGAQISMDYNSVVSSAVKISEKPGLGGLWAGITGNLTSKYNGSALLNSYSISKMSVVDTSEKGKHLTPEELKSILAKGKNHAVLVKFTKTSEPEIIYVNGGDWDSLTTGQTYNEESIASFYSVEAMEGTILPTAGGAFKNLPFGTKVTDSKGKRWEKSNDGSVVSLDGGESIKAADAITWAQYENKYLLVDETSAKPSTYIPGYVAAGESAITDPDAKELSIKEASALGDAYSGATFSVTSPSNDIGVYKKQYSDMRRVSGAGPMYLYDDGSELTFRLQKEIDSVAELRRTEVGDNTSLFDVATQRWYSKEGETWTSFEGLQAVETFSTADLENKMASGTFLDMRPLRAPVQPTGDAPQGVYRSSLVGDNPSLYVRANGTGSLVNPSGEVENLSASEVRKLYDEGTSKFVGFSQSVPVGKSSKLFSNKPETSTSPLPDGEYKVGSFTYKVSGDSVTSSKPAPATGMGAKKGGNVNSTWAANSGEGARFNFTHYQDEYADTYDKNAAGEWIGVKSGKPLSQEGQDHIFLSHYYSTEIESHGTITSALTQKKLSGIMAKGLLQDSYGTSIVAKDYSGAMTFFGSPATAVSMKSLFDDLQAGEGFKAVQKNGFAISAPLFNNFYIDSFGLPQNTATPEEKLSAIKDALEVALDGLDTAPVVGDASHLFEVTPMGKFKKPLAVSAIQSIPTQWDSATSLNSYINTASGSIGGGKIIGKHKAKMSKSDKAQWVQAFQGGDFATMYALESKAASAEGKPHVAGFLHPGYEGNKETNQVVWAPAVEGETSALDMVDGNWTPVNSSAKPSMAEVDNYLIKAQMQNPTHLTSSEKRNWVTWHRNSNQEQIDKLSSLAQLRAKNGDSPLSEPASWADDVQPAKTYTALFDDTQYPLTWNLEQSAEFYEDNPDLVGLKGFVDSHIDNEGYAHGVKRGVTDYFQDKWDTPVYTQMTNVTLPKSAHTVIPMKDQKGKTYFFKPEPTAGKHRTELEHQSHLIAQAFGYSTPQSQLMTVNGKYGQMQHDLKPVGDMTNMDFSTLQRSQLTDLASEHVLDWFLDNDDSKASNILVLSNGKLVGIDKGRAFKTYGAWKGFDGSAAMNSNSHQVYSDMYDAIRSGAYDKATLDKVYMAARRKALKIEKVSDSRIQEMLTEGVKNRTDWSIPYKIDGKQVSQNAEGLVAAALDRKSKIVSDFDKMWEKLYKDAGLGDLPEPGAVEALPEGIHSGFVSDTHYEAVKKTQSLGVTTMVSGSSVIGGHVLMWNEDRGDGHDSLVGEVHLAPKAQASFLSYLAANSSGMSKSKAETEGFVDSASYGAKVTVAAKTVNKHAVDGEYNSIAISDLESSLSLMLSEQSEWSPSISSNTSSNGLDAYKFSTGTVVPISQIDQYKMMLDHYIPQALSIQKAHADKVKVEHASIFSPITVGNKTTTYQNSDASETLKVFGDKAFLVKSDKSVALVELNSVDMSNWTKMSTDETSQSSLPGGVTIVKKSSTFEKTTEESNWQSKTKKTTAGAVFGAKGQEFEVTLPTGEKIYFRNSGQTDTARAQQGKMSWVVSDSSQDEAQAGLERVQLWLEGMGLDFGEANSATTELNYWREMYGVFASKNPSLETGSKYKDLWKDMQALIESIPGNSGTFLEDISASMSPDEENQVWRDLYSKYWPAEVEEMLDARGYLPKFDRYDLDNPEEGTGKPYWLRFDVSDEDLVKTNKALFTTTKHADAFFQGGAAALVSGEERIRLFGTLHTGGSYGSSSASQDQGNGASHGIFTRIQNLDSASEGSVIFSPSMLRRTRSYSLNGDYFGDLNKRKTSSPSDPRYALSNFAGGNNETILPHYASLLSGVELVILQDTQRNAAIQFLKSKGIFEIRGVPIEGRIVTPGMKKAALKKLKEEAWLAQSKW